MICSPNAVKPLALMVCAVAITANAATAAKADALRNFEMYYGIDIGIDIIDYQPIPKKVIRGVDHYKLDPERGANNLNFEFSILEYGDLDDHIEWDIISIDDDWSIDAHFDWTPHYSFPIDRYSVYGDAWSGRDNYGDQYVSSGFQIGGNGASLSGYGRIESDSSTICAQKNPCKFKWSADLSTFGEYDNNNYSYTYGERPDNLPSYFSFGGNYPGEYQFTIHRGVTTVPLPPSVFLFTGALAALGSARWLRRSRR